MKIKYNAGTQASPNWVDIGSTSSGSVNNGYMTVANGDYSTSDGWMTTTTNTISSVTGSTITNITIAEDQVVYVSSTSSYQVGDRVRFYYKNSQNKTITYINKIYDIGNFYGANSITLDGSLDYPDDFVSYVAGTLDKISGDNAKGAHAEGRETVANSPYSHAEGKLSKTFGEGAHAEGFNTSAKGYYSHTEGDSTVANGDFSKAVGGYTVTGEPFGMYVSGNTNGSAKKLCVTYPVDVNQFTSGDTVRILDGSNNTVTTLTVSSVGSEYDPYGNLVGYMFMTTAFTYNSSTWQRVVNNDSNKFKMGKYAQASGYGTYAHGLYSATFGTASIAYGEASMASGYNSYGIGDYSFATGFKSGSTKPYAFSSGFSTWSGGQASHTEGWETWAVGNYAHSEGNETAALTESAHVEGDGSIAASVSSSYRIAIATTTTITLFTTPSGLTNGTEVFLIPSSSYAKPKKLLVASTSGAVITLTNNDNTTTTMGLSNYVNGYLIVLGSGRGAHAEGQYTISLGNATHAEGVGTYAYGNGAHSEGNSTQAIGNFSHAEGTSTVANGVSSHAEGASTYAYGAYSHAEGIYTLALPGGSTTGITTFSGASKTVTVLNASAFAVGNTVVIKRDTSAMALVDTISAISGNVITLATYIPDSTFKYLILPPPSANPSAGHAEGTQTFSTGYSAHSEGAATAAIGAASHAEGDTTIAVGVASHAQGKSTIAQSDFSNAEGYVVGAYRMNAHAEGVGSSVAYAAGRVATYNGTTGVTVGTSEGAQFAAGNVVHLYYLGSSSTVYRFETTVASVSSDIVTIAAVPSPSVVTPYYLVNVTQSTNGTASANSGHVEGFMNIARGNYSHVEGIGNTDGGYAGVHVIGQYGDANAANAFFLANGTSTSARGLAVKMLQNGTVTADGAYASTGADYAEMFEWKDGNVDNEDRAGIFVTLDGEKIRKATSNDDYIVGVVSATPSIIGDAGGLRWKDKYITDDFGRIQYHDVIIPAVLDEEGLEIEPERIERQPLLNPDWDNDESYEARIERKEWDAIGMMGKLLVRDDGSCQVNGFCQPNDEGIATNSQSGYRVMKRVTDSIILVLIK